MGLYPQIQSYDGGQEIVDVFRGLNRAEKISEGEWSEEQNLSSDRYPMLSVRAKRTAARTCDGYICSVLAKEKLAVLVVPNYHIQSQSAMEDTEPHVLACELWYGDASVPESFSFVYPTTFPGRMISFGAYIVIAGINAWYNTATGEKGYMDITFRPPEQEQSTDIVCSYYPVDEEGNKLTINARLTPEQGKEQEELNPQAYQDGECYAITENRIIRQYVVSDDGNYWRTVPNRTLVECDGIGTGQVGDDNLMPADPFHEGDWVEISGKWYAKSTFTPEFTGRKKIVSVAEDSLILDDVFSNFTLRVARWSVFSAEGNDAKIERKTPDMDFVIECQNRLWGCKYGLVDGKMINEIYATELGKFDSWRNYDGTSMASYAASVGTDGPWTGAISYQGKPHFFKEKHVHKVYISASGAHQIVDSPILGVQENCEHSLTVLDGRLYYLSRDGVCAYDGSTPVVISEALGDMVNRDASFAGARGKLYAQMYEQTGANSFTVSLYVYDTHRGIWHEERNSELLPMAAFAVLGDSLYACGAGLGHYQPVYTPDGIETTLWDLHGVDGEEEDDVVYTCTSGLIGWQNIEQKYISRFDMRLTLPAGATMTVWLEYDSSGTWEKQGTVTGGGTGSIMIPVRPRRCDHFRIRLTGSGEMRMFSWAKRLTKGSDRV